MRVAYLCADPGIPVFGTKGASVHVQEIIRAWRTRGADVHVYCTRTGDDVPADLADIPVTRIKVPGSQGPEREAAQAAAAVALAG
ncbi:MAG TPA: glycosyltransferase, partial [Arthrobacter sp.]|nr:glycosyltransferase [Arthrobacter sp.]